jgi:predicted RecB family nuclease
VPWSYEVIDTKLARETKGGTVLQLCLYSDLVSSVQGLHPEFSYVVSPWSDFEPQTFRMDDYLAYFRHVQGSLETAIGQNRPSETYPDPKAHCDICRWQDRCGERRRADDHLSLVAGITKLHIDELQRQGIATLAALGTMTLPLTWKPSRGAAQSYCRIREQARIQLEGRRAGRALHELLPVVSGLGLTSLPEPSAGDIFFDLEGDPFAGDGGLEYLFGYVFTGEDGTAAYVGDWALSRAHEKQIFERFVDFVVDRLKLYPDLHIYHFAPYEPSALKRLMGRYASRQEEIDSFLRSNRFVDLYSVVRNGLRASVESYSIKKLEALYGFTRNTALSDANMALTKIQSCLELGDIEFINGNDRDVVTGYNRDDCVSTRDLRDWLETRRTDLIASGTAVPRPGAPEGAPSEATSEWLAKIIRLIERLSHDVPAEIEARTIEQHARWLLAHSLDWHRREQKALWWEYFRLSALSAEDLLDEPAGISGLQFEGPTGGTTKSPVHRYSFPSQDTQMRGGEKLRSLGGERLGQVEDISDDDRWVEIKKRKDSADTHPEAVFAHDVIDTKVLANALVRIGEWVADNGIEGTGSFQAARDLLLRLPPRIGGQPIQRDNESSLDAAVRVASVMEGGVFPIQGPPGTGKTHTAARMICALVQQGKTVGVTANSHKVIRNLLDRVVRAGEEMNVDVRCIQKVREPETDQPRLRFALADADVSAAIGISANVAGGTAWLWASLDAAESVDVLFVDEAAQMALVNVLAVSQAAPRIVLLGDPQQLDQPVQGSHPEGTAVSGLHHILNEEQTIAADQGLFLAETWRLHPDICSYTSELFYENRLFPLAGLDRQEIRSTGLVHGSGLRFVAVPTEGNQSSSPEEADRIHELVDDILCSGATWVDVYGVERPVSFEDILIIAPYNAQVFELQDRLPGARIGTVDKFQGQEAAIVIYSMTTSNYADAPRGMEFLYSLNRLNVATSRARCLCILVASPSLFEVQCRTPRQMQLANAFCRYLEIAPAI